MQHDMDTPSAEFQARYGRLPRPVRDLLAATARSSLDDAVTANEHARLLTATMSSVEANHGARVRRELGWLLDRMDTAGICEWVVAEAAAEDRQRSFYWLPMLHECGHSMDWAVDLEEHDRDYLVAFIGRAAHYPCPWCGSASGRPSVAEKAREAGSTRCGWWPTTCTTGPVPRASAKMRAETAT